MIEIHNLEFTYPGNNRQTLKNLSFSVKQGEIFALLGPNGAGKTTLQRVLTGLQRTYKGSVKVMEQEIKNIDRSFYESIGVAFEFPNLYTKFSAWENLHFFKSLYNGPTEKIEDLLGLVGLEGDANTRVSDFSKGMKMRLNFCRSLLNNPKLIFLDEPTSGLDPVNLQKIKKIIISRKNQGNTIIITTHDMHIAESLCDRVAFIVDGKISLIDTVRELRIKKGSRKVKLEYLDKGTIIRKEFELEQIGANEEFLDLLKTREIETIHSQEASLEDIFIQVTGKSLI